MWHRYLRRLASLVEPCPSGNRKVQSRRRFRPGLEVLEGRVTPTLNINLFSTGLLSIFADGPDTIFITAVNGILKVNDQDPMKDTNGDPVPVGAALIKGIAINAVGNFDNSIDLRGARAGAGFQNTGFFGINIQDAAGNNTIFGSEFDEQIGIPGDGTNVVNGGAGNNRVDITGRSNGGEAVARIVDEKQSVLRVEYDPAKSVVATNVEQVKLTFLGTPPSLTTIFPNVVANTVVQPKPGNPNLMEVTAISYSDGNNLSSIQIKKIIYENVSSVEVKYESPANSAAVVTPSNVPLSLVNVPNVVLNTRGLAFNQNGSVFTQPGAASIDTGNAQNVVEEDLDEPGIRMIKNCRMVGNLVEYTITIFNDTDEDVDVGIVDNLPAGSFQGIGDGDIPVSATPVSGGTMVTSELETIGSFDIKTIKFFVKPPKGTLKNEALLFRIVDFPIPIPILEGVAEDSCTIQVEVDPSTATLNDPANDGMASQASDFIDSTQISLAGPNPVYSSIYPDIFKNVPNATKAGHLALGDPFMVDVAADGVSEGNGFSPQGTGDATGRFIAFQSTATNLVNGVTEGNAGSDIFLRDMFLGQTILVSRSTNDPNQTANAPSGQPVISGNGKYVYFISLATNLVDLPINNTQSNLFRFNVETAEVELVNVNTAGDGSANKGLAFSISTSFDGEIVAFDSLASDLTADTKVNNVNTETDVFVRDMIAGVTALASHHHTNATTGNLNSFSPLISSNGTKVVYTSKASDIVDLPDPNNADLFNKQDVFVYDVATGANELVSINASATATGDQSSTSPQVTPDAQFITFQSLATDLVTGVGGLTSTNVYVRDLVNGVTEILTVDPSGLTAGNGISQGPSISDDGRFISFSSRASNLTTMADANNTFDIFVRDRLADLTTPLSVNVQGTAAANGGSFLSVITADGKTAFFPSEAEDLVTNDGNDNSNVFSSNQHLRFTFRAPLDGVENNLVLRRNGANYEVFDADLNIVRASRPVIATETIVVIGADNETDTLTIDFASGFFDLPQGIRFEGGAGGSDRLSTIGDFTTASYGPIDAATGLAEFDGLVVSYTGLEVFEDGTVKEIVVFLVPEADANQVRLNDDGIANNGMSQIDSNGTGAFLTHVFANPTTALLLQGADGDDTIVAAGIDAAFAGILQMNGGVGNDTLDASALAGDVTLDGGPGDDDLRGGGGDDLLADGGGNDELNGGAGDDAYQLTPGSDDMVTDTAGTDTLYFRFADAAITLDLDLLNVPQVVNLFGDTVMLSGDFEAFAGSVFNDTLSLGPTAFARFIQGNPEVIGLAPGDVLNFTDATATDDGTTIRTPGFADVTHAGIEAVNLADPPPPVSDVTAQLVGRELRLTGSEAADFLRIRQIGGKKKKVEVQGLNGTTINGQAGPLTFKKVKSLTAELLGGDDDFHVTGKPLTKGTVLRGGEGNDLYDVSVPKRVAIEDDAGNNGLDASGMEQGLFLNLGFGPFDVFGQEFLTVLGQLAVVVGTDYDDILAGDGERNLLIGRGGNDLIIGGGGDDLLIGGRTAFDDDPAARRALVAEWRSNRSFAERVANLAGTGTGDRLNGDFFLQPGVTVFAGQDGDQLFGGPGQDWPIA